MIIGMTGHAGSGKDTTAAILADMLRVQGHGHHTLYAFAFPLKEFTQRVFALTYDDVHGTASKERHIEFEVDRIVLLRRFEAALFDIISTYIDREIDENPHLCDHNDINDVFIDRFADVLSRRSVSEMFDVFLTVLGSEHKMYSSWRFWKYNKLLFSTSPRRLLQLIGTEFFRDSIDNQFWCKIAPKADVIYTDVRFAEEYNLTKSLGGVVVRVINENLAAIASSGHASEQNINKLVPDYILTNDGKSIDRLTAEAAKTLNTIIAEKKE